MPSALCTAGERGATTTAVARLQIAITQSVWEPSDIKTPILPAAPGWNGFLRTTDSISTNGSAGAVWDFMLPSPSMTGPPGEQAAGSPVKYPPRETPGTTLGPQDPLSRPRR